MRNRLIVWVVLNITVLGFVFIYPSLFKYPFWWIICVFSNDILKTKKQLNTHYFTKLPTKVVVLGLAFPVIMIIAALINASNYKGGSFQWFDENHFLLRVFIGCGMALILLMFFKRVSNTDS